MRLTALLAGAVLCGTAAGAGTVAEVEAHVPARGAEVPTYTAEVPGATPDTAPGTAGRTGAGAAAGSAGGTVITPVPTGSSNVRRRGPSVELISGGNSADGAARVGRLPVLD